jgi:aspartate racemase
LASDEQLGRAVLPAIEKVKAGEIALAGKILAPVVQSLLDQGAEAVLLACTGVPMALDAIGSPLRARCVDTPAALARTCVRFWMSRAHTR